MKNLQDRVVKKIDAPFMLAIIIALICSVIVPARVCSGEIEKYLSLLPFTMPPLKEPVFPDTRVSIVEHGAVNDGRTLNTQAINSAIQACAKTGGGKVVVPPGTWLTGSIKLESNVNLHLERGALVQFSGRVEDYSLMAGFDGKSKRYFVSPPLYSYRATNIAITGEGVIDGAGEKWRYVKKEKLTEQQWRELTQSGGVVTPDGRQWWPSKAAMEGEAYLAELQKREKSGDNVSAEDYAKAREFLRPDMVRLVQSEGILLDGPTFQNSPRFHVYLFQSENIIVRNIKIKTEWYAQNGDGLDLNSCRNVLMYNSRVDVGDDAICLKPGNIADKQKPGPACENIVIADCIVNHGHGGFVIGSESHGGARNVYVKNCIFAGTDVGLRFKSLRGKGGVIENIYIDGIQMRAIGNEALLFDMYYGEGSPEFVATEKSDEKTVEPVNDRTPRFQNFSIKNIVCTGANRAILINGLPEMQVKNISLENVSIAAMKGALCIDTDSITFTNVSLFPEEGEIVTLKQSSNITLKSVTYPQNAGVFLSVFGEKTKNVLVKDVNLNDAGKQIVFGKNTSKEAVIIK